MKIGFFGTPDFAVPALNALVDSKHDIVLVITQPDKPVGRKKILNSPPIKTAASKHDIPILQPQKLDNSFLESYKNYSPDINIVIAYGKIMPDELIFFPKYDSINIHASLLPKYRGAAPINAAILNNDSETGISFQFIKKELDAGDIIHEEKIPIIDTDNAITLTEKLSRLSASSLLNILEMIQNNSAKRVPQKEEKASYVKQMKKEDGKLNFNMPARSIYNMVRGLVPWPVAFCILNEKKLKIFSCEIVESTNGNPGEITEIIKNSGFIVKAADKSLLIKEIQPEGGKRMNAQDFILGHKNLLNTLIK